MAFRRGRDHKRGLNMMLPRLQGLAGDYVFGELGSGKHSNYGADEAPEAMFP